MPGKWKYSQSRPRCEQLKGLGSESDGCRRCWSGGGGGREGRGACQSDIPAALSARSCCPAEPSRAGPGTGGSQPPCEAGNLGENQFPAPIYPNRSRGSRVAQGRGRIPARSWLAPGFNFGLFGKRGAPGNVAGMGMSGLCLRFHLDSGSGSSNPLGISRDPQIPLENSFPGKPSGILSL